MSAKSALPSTSPNIESPRKVNVTTHTVITITPKQKASQNTRNMINIHGPSFRVPLAKSNAFVESRQVIPVCGLRDNWVGWLFEDEITY